MRANEFLAELDPHFVNQEIKKQNPKNGKEVWKQKGQGATASVWQHYDDPNTVVKVVGGGEYESFKHERGSTLAFVHFLVDHGYRSPHFPIVHGINIDDDEVLQVRIEKLVDASDQICDDCAGLARAVRNGSPKGEMKYYINVLTNTIAADSRYRGKNTTQSILEAVQLLKQAIPVYASAHGLPRIRLDLHAGNWLARPNGIIVAADPWYTETSYGDRPGADSGSSYSTGDDSGSSNWAQRDQSSDGWGIPRES